MSNTQEGQSQQQQPQQQYYQQNPQEYQQEQWRQQEASRMDVERQYLERQNACHLNATNEQATSELHQRAAAAEPTFDMLFQDSEKKLGDHYQRSLTFDFNLNKEHPNYERKLDWFSKASFWACEQYESMQEYIPDRMKDFINGSCKMIENKLAMKMWNHTEAGWDKVFHCMGNCESAEYSQGGFAAAVLFSNMNEVVFGDEDSGNDQRANHLGRESVARCYTTCSGYVPEKYRDSFTIKTRNQ